MALMALIIFFLYDPIRLDDVDAGYPLAASQWESVGWMSRLVNQIVNGSVDWEAFTHDFATHIAPRLANGTRGALQLLKREMTDAWWQESCWALRETLRQYVGGERGLVFMEHAIG